MKKWNHVSLLFVIAILYSYTGRSWSQESVATKLPKEFEETLMQAKEDLSSESEQRRLSAAILLGKYTYTQSQQFLLTALDDASPAVRRAAVVSLREHAKFSNIADVEKILTKLGDKDVEVRRAVSSAVSNLGRHLGRFAASAQPSGYRYTLPPDLKKIVLSAFVDEDYIVRVNIARSFFRLNLALPPDIAATLLGDAHAEIVIATLQILGTISLTDEILDQIEGLSKSDNYHIRVALIENLIDSNDERVVALLMQLTDSNNPHFKLTHYILKVRHGGKLSKNDLADVMKLLSSFNKRSELLDKLLKRVHLFKSKTVDLVLIRHNLLTFRITGWENYFRKEISGDDSKLLLQGLNDTSSKIRQTIINYLLRSPGLVSKKLVESMIASSRENVRIGAAELLIKMSPTDAADFILPLLVDETAQVRAGALRVIIKHRPKNWHKMLKRSLQDRDFSVQKQSVSLLFSIGREGIQIVQTYAQKNSQTAIAQHINAEFVRRKIQPLPSTDLQTKVINKE